MQFDGEVAIVTGGASGIGWEVGRQLAERGAAVVLADLDEAAATRRAEQLRAEGWNALGVPVDVSNADSVHGMLEAVSRDRGTADILVHSAGIGMERRFLDTSLEEWERVIRIDLTGSFITGQAVARLMSQRGGGRIVFLASTAGLRGGTGRAAYGAAKGGVITLTKVMAVELAPFGITVNALAPGAIETELVARMHSAETRLVYRRGIPLDRYGTPGETAAAAVFLASREAAYITGQIMAVDGGFMAAGVMHRRDR